MKTINELNHFDPPCICVRVCVCLFFGLVWGYLFNGTSTFVGYLIPKSSLLRNSGGTT